MHYVPEQNNAAEASAAMSAAGYGYVARLPLDPGRLGDMADWKRREPADLERGSKALTWGVVVLLLGFVGLVLVTPSTSGQPHEQPSYTD